MSSILIRKPLNMLMEEAHQEGEHTLKRALSALNLTTLGIGAIIGAGIFVLTGSAAAQYAGPAIVLSFILAGVGCVFAGLCYAEFASLIPIAGSAYTYGYATLGELFAWIIGWDLILEYAFGAATVASGWSANVFQLLQRMGIYLPPRFMATPGTDLVQYQGLWRVTSTLTSEAASKGVDLSKLPHVTGTFNAIAFLAICMVTVILVIGIQESATLNTIIVFIKVGTVLVFIGIAGRFVLAHPTLAAANWHPFIPPNTGEYGRFGWSGIGRGAAVIFFAYIGFDAVSTAAQEAKNPQKDMPMGILGSLAICTVLYIATSLLLTGVTKYTTLNVAAPVAVGIMATGVRWGEYLVLVGSIFGLSTVMLVMLLGQSRVFYSMSRDGLLPAWAGKVHPRFRTPYISSITVGLFVAVFGSVIPIGVLGELVSIGTLLAFVIVCAGVWVLRVRQPDLHRPFKAPMLPLWPIMAWIMYGVEYACVWLVLRLVQPDVHRPFKIPRVPLVPVLGILVSLYLMVSLPFDTWLRLIIWLVIGLVIYFCYGRHHSKVTLAANKR